MIMCRIKTQNMFLAVCQEIINAEGRVCVGWQLKLNNEGEQENCFHYYDTKQGVKRIFLQKGLEYVEIHRPRGQRNKIMYI